MNLAAFINNKFFGIQIAAWWLLVLCSSTALAGDDTTRNFNAGLDYYEQGAYEQAVESFLDVVNSGIISGRLFYNLGNAYFKAGDIGRARLWYERALKHNPHDPDLKFNHAYTMTRLKDEPDDSSGQIWRILFFWKYLFSVKATQWIGIILHFMFWLLVTVRFVRKKKRLIGTTGALLMIVSLIFMVTALYNIWEERYRPQAVILPVKVSVRAGLSEDSTELFSLHAGTKVLVQRQYGDYRQIRFSENKIGWVKAVDVELITPYF